jgi:hypothetical protein
MDAITLIVAALGGGVVATVLNEWARSRREYDEARLLVMSELATMRELALAVLAGRFTSESIAVGGLNTAAWETYKIRLVRRLATHVATWGMLDATYASIGMARENPSRVDMDALSLNIAEAHDALAVLALRPLWPPRALLRGR